MSFVSIPLEGVPAVLQLSKIQAVLQTLSSNYEDTNLIIKNYIDFTFLEFDNKISTKLILLTYEKDSKCLKISSLNSKNLILFTNKNIDSLDNLSNSPNLYSERNSIINNTFYLQPDDVILLHSEFLFSNKEEINKIYKIITENNKLSAEDLKLILCKSLKFNLEAFFFTIIKVR